MLHPEQLKERWEFFIQIWINRPSDSAWMWVSHASMPFIDLIGGNWKDVSYITDSSGPWNFRAKSQILPTMVVTKIITSASGKAWHLKNQKHFLYAYFLVRKTNCACGNSELSFLFFWVCFSVSLPHTHTYHHHHHRIDASLKPLHIWRDDQQWNLPQKSIANTQCWVLLKHHSVFLILIG